MERWQSRQPVLEGPFYNDPNSRAAQLKPVKRTSQNAGTALKMASALKSPNRPHWKRLVHLQARISMVDKIKPPVMVGAGEWFNFAEGKGVE
jgi:hypothetical protein